MLVCHVWIISTKLLTTISLILSLERLYSAVVNDAAERITDTLDVLVHDGYLEVGPDGGYRFPSHLLKDWWAARFRDHHTPLKDRQSDDKS